MIMNIETMPAMKVAYMRNIGMYGPANSMMMGQFKNWVKESGFENEDTIILGVARDNPSVVNPDTCRYDACLVLGDEEVEETDVIHIGEFEGGKYAVFQLDHTAEAIQKAWQNIFTELKSKGHMVDNTRGMVERYTAKMDAEHKCEICIPVK